MLLLVGNIARFASVVRMLVEIGTEARIPEFLAKAKDKNDRFVICERRMNKCQNCVLRKCGRHGYIVLM